MVTETIPETTETQVDPEPQPTVTETPETPQAESESAAPETETAATTPQLEVVEEKPTAKTDAEWEQERREIAARAAQDALEADRRRRQTEGARKAQQERRDAELRAETQDVVRATLSAKLGVDPSLITDDAIDTAISRAARRQAESLTAGSLDSVEQAWDYLTAPAYGKQIDLDPEFEAAASRLGPKLQHLVNTIRPQIEEQARKGYIHESELPKIKEAAIAAHNASLRDGTEDLKRPEGAASGMEQGSPGWWSALGREGRAKPENQLAYDAWVARHR